MYNYEIKGNKVICTSTYAKKPVRGTAICADEDTFSEIKGMELARLRCDVRVAQKRCVNARRRYEEALEAFIKADQYLTKMRDYTHDADRAVWEAAFAVNEALKSM